MSSEGTETPWFSTSKCKRKNQEIAKLNGGCCGMHAVEPASYIKDALSNGGDPLCERWLTRPPLSHAILSPCLHYTKQNKKVKGLEMGLYQVVALGEKQQVHLRVARRMGGRE